MAMPSNKGLVGTLKLDFWTHKLCRFNYNCRIVLTISFREIAVIYIKIIVVQIPQTSEQTTEAVGDMRLEVSGKLIFLHWVQFQMRFKKLGNT